MGFETREASTSGRIATTYTLRPAAGKAAGWSGQRSAHKPRPAWRFPLPAVSGPSRSFYSFCALGPRTQDAVRGHRAITEQIITTHILQPAAVNSADWPGQGGSHKPGQAWRLPAPAVGDPSRSFDSLCALGLRVQDGAPGHGATTTTSHQNKNNNNKIGAQPWPITPRGSPPQSG